jgi:hypothetical protein
MHAELLQLRMWFTCATHIRLYKVWDGYMTERGYCFPMDEEIFHHYHLLKYAHGKATEYSNRALVKKLQPGDDPMFCCWMGFVDVVEADIAECLPLVQATQAVCAVVKRVANPPPAAFDLSREEVIKRVRKYFPDNEKLLAVAKACALPTKIPGVAY